MGLFDRIGGEFIDVIEWLDDSRDTMVWRFERHGNEIKHGAKLTVRESQVAVFVSEGQIADVFRPGMYTLETKNIPILSTLQGWKYGFESPFKAEVYFVNTRLFTDLKWGTKNPVMLRDAEFGPVRLRAFGSYAVKVADPGVFIKEIAGTDAHFTLDEVTDQLRNLIVASFARAITSAAVPVLDLAANYDQLGAFITQRIQPDFAGYGLTLAKLLVENVSLPEEVEKALDKRTAMGVVGDLGRYAQFQAAEAMAKAAEGAGATMGANVGVILGGQLGQAPPAPQAPPPLPASGPSYHLAVGGKQTGPFGMSALADEVKAGRLGRDTLVWSQGMAAWTKAGEVAALAPLFADLPPPLPPNG